MQNRLKTKKRKMNKVINVFSIIVLVLFTMLSMVIIYDLAISNLHLKGLPYKIEILSGLAVVFFLIGVIRIRRRWQGLRDMNKFSQFDFDSDVSKTFINRSMVFTMLEIAFMLAALYLFSNLASISTIDYQLMIVMICAISILIIESILFLFQILRAGKAFRIGINDRVIAYYGREIHLFYYAGLRRVELHQQDLFSFQYKDDLVLFFPASVLKEEDRIPFREVLLQKLEDKNIYFDDALRNWE